ncbi:MAG: hypothetical protein QGF09_16470, partial [Rhodospirillales bacterium]|nr:hypothetical protein [Rhodospirillales bacterium]
NLIYSISPVHTDDYYRERTREAAKLGADRLCLKDPGGLLTPERTRDLAQVMLAEAGDTPLEFHTHCITGLGPICALEAIQAGIGIINTATPPLANASSNPSVFNVCENAQALGYSPAIDLEALKPISEHFEKVAQQNSFPIGTPAEYSQASYMHQVPGGMISNLRHQLGLINHADKLDQVLEETARVREELGYPIMVTPYSQFVGAQAVMNVIMGERYKQISDQVIQYAMGFWGEEERGAVDKNLLDRICTSPRARELEGWQIPEPSIEEVRKQMGGTDLDGDEFLLHFFAGGEAVAAMRAAPPPSEYSVDGTQPVVTLIKELMKKPNFSSVRIEGDGLALHLVSSKQ